MLSPLSPRSSLNCSPQVRYRCLRAAKEFCREFDILQYISINLVALDTIQPDTRKVLEAQVAIVVNLCASCIRRQL